MDTSARKKEIAGISFARAILILLIVFIHFLGGSGRKFSVFSRYLYPPWSSLLAADFLAISGAVLYYNHPKVPSLKEFYIRRAKAIYPPFYLAFGFYYVLQVFRTGDLFPHGQAWSLIFTVLGIDGYVGMKFPTYSLVGEWSLGAIIILYLLYPFLAKCMKKAPWITFGVIVAGYVVMLKTMFLTDYAMRNIFTCMMSFYFGMLVIRYENIFLKNSWIGAVSLLFLILSGRVFSLPLDPCTVTQLNGYAFFFVLYYAGEYLMRLGPIKTAVGWLGKISYCLFLMHHPIVNDMLAYQNPASLGPFLIVFLAALFLSLAAAKVLWLVSKDVMGWLFPRKTDNITESAE